MNGFLGLAGGGLHETKRPLKLSLALMLFTIWLSGVTPKAAPGERAVLDGRQGDNDAVALTVEGSYGWYWDLEVESMASFLPPELIPSTLLLNRHGFG